MVIEIECTEEGMHRIAGLGDNICIREASADEHLPTGIEVVAEWEEEAKHLDFRNPKWNPSGLKLLMVYVD